MKMENSTATWERHLTLPGDLEELIVYKSEGRKRHTSFIKSLKLSDHNKWNFIAKLQYFMIVNRKAILITECELKNSFQRIQLYFGAHID